MTAALTGGPASPLIAWLVIPIVSLAGRFDTRGVWGGAGVVLVALAAICAVHPHAFADDPVYVIAVVPLALAVAFAAALPVNKWLLGRGKGHALTHEFHGREAQRTWIPDLATPILVTAIAAFFVGGLVVSTADALEDPEPPAHSSLQQP